MMKKLLLIYSLLCSATCLLAQTDTSKIQVIKPEDASKYIGQRVTVYGKAAGFESREVNRYFFYGDKYPNQIFTVIVKPDSAGNRLKMNWSTMARKATVYFTGVIEVYHGKKDKTKDPQQERLAKALKERPLYFEGKPIALKPVSQDYAIDLRDKLVMVIDREDQIKPGEMVRNTTDAH